MSDIDDERADVRRLLDRQEIVELMHNYAFAIDDRDWDLLERVFTSDAQWETPKHRADGFQAILATITQVTSELDRTHHIVGNATVYELTDTSATGRCYLWAQHVLEGTPGGDLFVVGGEYRDRYVRTDAGWRIAHRRLNYGWTDGNPDVRKSRS